jgi:hypothetical protein
MESLCNACIIELCLCYPFEFIKGNILLVDVPHYSLVVLGIVLVIRVKSVLDCNSDCDLQEVALLPVL